MTQLRVPFRSVRVVVASAALIAVLAPRGAAQFEELWTKRFGDPGTKDFLVLDSGVASDGSLRMLAIVQRDDPMDPTALAGIDNLLLLSISNHGEVEWARSFHQEPNWSDIAGGLRVAGDGCAYVASRFNGMRTLTKYSQHGDVLWRRNLDLNFFIYQKIVMALDADGRVTIAGNHELVAFEEADLAVVQFDADGKERWRATYAGPGQGGDLPVQMAYDGRGRVHLTGTTAGAPAGAGNSIVTLAFDADGQLLWSTQLGRDPTDWNWPAAVEVAADGSTSLAATIQPPIPGGANTNASWVLRIDPDGLLVWSHHEPMPHGVVREYSGVTVAPWGDVLVAGWDFHVSNWTGGQGTTARVECFSDLGEKLWSEGVPGACGTTGFMGSPLFDRNGRVVLLTWLGNDCYPKDMQLMLLSGDGSILAEHAVDVPGSSFAFYPTVQQGPHGDLYIVSRSNQGFPADGALLYAACFALD